MNQILDYNPNKSSGGGSSGSDKVVRVFAILLGALAVVLIITGVYGWLSNKKKEETTQVLPSKAKISFESKDAEIIIKVEHDKIIDKMVYCWDGGKETTIKGNSENTMEETIQANAGEHVLTVKVTDVDGNESSYEETLTSTEGNDLVFPTITLEPNGNKLKIKAEDDKGMNFVTYRWNTDDEVKVEDKSEDGLSIEFEIDILVGKNDLVVVASDSSGNVSNESRSYTGVLNPEIEMTVSSDKKMVDIKATHEEGLKAITITINGQDYPYELSDNPTEATYQIQLVDQETKIVVKAESKIGTTKSVEENVVQDVPEDEMALSLEKTDVNLVHAKVECAAGLKEVVLNVNGTDYAVPLDEGSTVNEFDFQVVENCTATVKATSINGTQKETSQDFEFEG